MFWEDFFGRIFLEGFFMRNSLLELSKLFEYGRSNLFYQDFGFCQNFHLNGEERKKNFESLEMRAQAHCTHCGLTCYSTALALRVVLPIYFHCSVITSPELPE